MSLSSILIILALTTSTVVIGVQLCNKKLKDCEGESCYKSIPCYHGDCDEAGTCECDLCWQGDDCSKFVDKYLPLFPNLEETAIVSDPWNQDSVYTAHAYDSDLGTTCPLEAMLCDCAEIRYSLDDGNVDGLFHINNLTGDVYIREATQVKSGSTYELILSAHTATGEKSESPNANMHLKIIIDDLHHHLQNVLQQNVLSWMGDGEQHSREKRSAEIGNHLTEFNCTLLSGELETMEPGHRLDFRLEILVPRTDGMDLTVEFFTKEIGNGNYTPVLALFNVVVEDKPPGLTFSKGKPHIEMLLSDDVMTAYDRAIVTFGDVKNTGTDALPITMLFSVTQIRNPGTIFDTKYLVTAGAEYDKETYIWVGQSEVTVHNTTDEKKLEVDILGPEEIPLDSAGVYVIRAHCAVRSENFTFDVTGPEQTEVVTVGNLGVKDFDKNYDPVPQSIYFYNTTKKGSDDDVIYTSASLNLGIMTNVGDYKEAREEGNVINITFAIYALNNETNLNKEIEFEVRITVGREEIYKQSKPVKLVPRVGAKKMVTAGPTKGELTTTSVTIGDMAIYTLWSNLTNGGYADYVLEVGVPRDNKGLPRLEACSARLWNYMGSFNVPYINTTFIDPAIEKGKYVFKFNRIHVTGQRTPSIYNDSMIFVHLVVKISAMAVNKAESRLTPTIAIGTEGKAETEVKVPAIVIAGTSEFETPVMQVENGVLWPYLYGGGAIVLNVTMFVPRGQGYAQVKFEASGENNPPLPAVHICRAELSDVGRNVPCLRMHQAEVNENFTSYAKTDPKVRTRPDMTSVMLGDVGALPVDGKNMATVSIVVELPEGENFKDNDQYPISSSLLIESKSIWGAMANYTMKKAAPPDLEEANMPEASAFHDAEELVVPGHLAQVEIRVDTKIQTISAFTIEVEGTTKDISLCGLKVKSFGRNLPCVNMETEPFYYPHDNPLDGNKISGIKFSALSNVGFRSDLEHDRLVVIALVRIGPSCRQPTTELLWRVIFGGGKREGKVSIKVDLNADTSDMSVSAKEPKALAFKPAYPNKAISMGSPVVVDLEVSLEPGSLAPVIVAMKNLDAAKKRFPYDMCLGGIWFRGRNYPCFSPVQVESNFSSSDSDGGRNDSAVYNLGLVCNTFVDNREEENKVTIRLAMRPVDDGSLKIRDQFSVEGFATVGTHHKKIDTVKFSIAREPDQVETGLNASVKLVNVDPIPIRVHQRLWIPFNISIPIDAVVKVQAEARAPYKDDRAILTVHKMRLVSGGINIPCPMLYPQPKVTFNPTVTTTQNDVIRGDIGYFTNLGLTHKMNMAVEGDDDLTVEVEVELSDHPLTDNDKIFQLKFIAEVGRSILDIDQPMRVWRDGSERADLDVRVAVNSNKTYQSGDRINVTVSVFHTQASTAEPINATIRLYLPPYIEFEGKVFENSSAKSLQFITDFGGLDIVLSQFLFSDYATIIISLLADPKNERGFGRGEVNATTPYRVLCRQNFREEPSANPQTPETIVNCGPVDYIMYLVNSQECFKQLGLNSPKKIYKCQISASSAAKKETAPFNIRYGGKKGWSPALRLGPHKPYLQVDFLRPTRLAKMEFMKLEETRGVTKYRLQYSHTGSDWLYANDITELVYKKDIASDILAKPIQTRFVRVVIEEAEKGEEDTKYIGLKMEMYGCHIGDKSSSVTCARNDPTWYSDDKNKYGRHFSVDLGRDIVYFCDLEYDMENLLCFSSIDAGNSWRILPRSIGGILGYDKKAGRTYAIDKRKRAYVASDDGITWVAVDELDVNTTATKKSFYRSQPVPAFTSEDIEMLETKTGRWEATFDGLMYENKPDPRAKWSRCCKLTK